MHRKVLFFFFNGSSNPIVLHISSGPTTSPLQPGVAFESFQELRVSYLSWLPLVSGEIHARDVFEKGTADVCHRCLTPLFSWRSPFAISIAGVHLSLWCAWPLGSSLVKGAWCEGLCLILSLEQINSLLARGWPVNWDVKHGLQQ